MDELLKLIESSKGKLSLTLYRQDGYCWHKLGELRVTDKLIAELRRALSAGDSDVPAG